MPQHKLLSKSVNLGGIQLDLDIETSGYRGGDNSILHVGFVPKEGYQHRAVLHDKNRLTDSPDDFATDNALQVCFTARGDMELDVLRAAIKVIDQSFDELLGEPRSTPSSTTHFTETINL